PPEIVERYFITQSDGRYGIDAKVRSLVDFGTLNLAGMSFPNPATGTQSMDLILCRNVIMYFPPNVQERVVRRLCAALNQDGWLATSPAEAAADLFSPLQPVNLADAILFHKRSTAASSGDGVVPRRAKRL